MRTNAHCANSTVIQPKLTSTISMQQETFKLQPQMIHSTTNTTHFNFRDLHSVSLNNTNVENFWLLSTNQILGFCQLSSSQLCDDKNVLYQTSSNKQQYKPI